MQVEIETTSNSVTITYDGSCDHKLHGQDAIVPLGCPNHDYKHLVGYACLKCYEQWFKPGSVWCVDGATIG